MIAPLDRLSTLNARPTAADGAYVLYWMNAQRRTGWNFGLEHAVARARELSRPLLVYEGLSASYRWASDRFHAFVLDGMRANAAACEAAGVSYYPYVEPDVHAGRGLLAALTKGAALVVTDEWPCFHLPRWVARVAAESTVRVEAVDSCGILPLRSAGKEVTRAFDMRRHLQKVAVEALHRWPLAAPLADYDRARGAAALPRALTKRWPASDLARVDLSALPIDHSVGVVTTQPGGQDAARARLLTFVQSKLARYPERNEPMADATSGLSPHLHFGHIGAHEVLDAVLRSEDWDPSSIEAARPTGKREGFWGLSAAAEGFIDELITWREVCFNTAFHRPDDYDRFDSLPAFARTTLAKHAGDPRPRLYSLEQLDAAETDDDVWNAAQRQLRREGVIHNYLRMLWGKRVLTWTRDARQALEFLIEMNNKWSLDGRDPNSYGGIFWCLGRYDRGWPEREVFGVVRSMTSASTRRKLDLDEYLVRYGKGQRALFD
ncbi:MAG: deoxyribodipyrimidine photolyase [Planctomycetota bacterium]